VCDLLRKYAGADCIVEEGKNRDKTFRYCGEDDDPLKEYREGVAASFNEYLQFCMESTNFFPIVWLEHFFKGNTDLFFFKQNKKSDDQPLTTDSEQDLKNKEMLPIFYEAIKNGKVLRVKYESFDKIKLDKIFHPQHIREYNNRWFVFGKAEDTQFYPLPIAIDRIQEMPEEVADEEYSPAEQGFYAKFFKDILGVTHEVGSQVEKIKIRTHNIKVHGLIMTKPLHKSQEEISKFQEQKDGEYGEIELTIEPNRELISRILSFGSGLEIVSPESLRQRIGENIKEMMNMYNQ